MPRREISGFPAASDRLRRRLPTRTLPLDAAPTAREHLGRAATPLGVEGGPEGGHRGEVVGGEELGHELQLLDADAVLTGDAAADGDAFLQDLVAGQEHAPDLLRVTLVEQEDRVDVAVAGMEDVGDPQAVMRADGVNLAEDVRQLGPGDDPILGAE